MGAGFTDHPNVYVGYRPARPLPMPPGLLPLHGVLHATSSGPRGARRPGDPAVADAVQPDHRRDGRAARGRAGRRGRPAAGRDSRGRLTLDDADPPRPPRLQYRYLAEEGDRRRAARGGAAGRGAAAHRSRSRRSSPGASDLPDAVLADDRGLDGWIRAHLTTAIHLAGTARMGPDVDPGAVVDQRLRVRGVSGLRVVDTSVMPTVTSRGPAATAVMLGERAAELMLEG